MLEAVVNVSEGRDRRRDRRDRRGRRAARCSTCTPTPTTTARVFTIAAREAGDDRGRGPAAHRGRARGPRSPRTTTACTRASASSTSCRSSRSAPTPADVAVAAAHAFGGVDRPATHRVPVFLYDDAAPDAPHPARRCGATRSRRRSRPTSGPAAPDPRLGATAVGRAAAARRGERRARDRRPRHRAPHRARDPRARRRSARACARSGSSLASRGTRAGEHEPRRPRRDRDRARVRARCATAARVLGGRPVTARRAACGLLPAAELARCSRRRSARGPGLGPSAPHRSRPGVAA